MTTRIHVTAACALLSTIPFTAPPLAHAQDLAERVTTRNSQYLEKLKQALSAGDDAALLLQLRKPSTLRLHDYAFQWILEHKDTPSLTALIENGTVTPPPSSVVYAAQTNNLPIASSTGS